MQTTLKVRRFNPESPERESYFQEYTLEVPDYSTVLDALLKVWEEVDGSLAMRCSCRAAICGSCSMRIDGHAKLACKTKIATLASKGGPITVEPMGNMPVVKDLVVDMKPFWDKMRAVQPYLQPSDPDPEMAERRTSNEAMVHLTGVMNCIMCGACVSDCTVLEVDSNFLGPAALAKAYRFVGDPRDGADTTRLGELNKYGGVWDCTRCYECVEVCPKGVAPMDWIMDLRDKAMEAGYRNTYGARHAEAFAESVEHSGWLNELRLPLKTFGLLPVPNVPKLMGLLPVGLRALRRRKMPPLFHKSRPGVEHVRRIFRKVGGKQ